MQTDPDSIRSKIKGQDFKFKFYRMSGKSAGGWPWKWPFVDIMPYKEIDNGIKKMDNANEQKYHLSIDEMYPLHMRPLGRLWLPAPQNTRTFLQKKYNHFKCKQHNWIHKKESYRKTQVDLPCSDILPTYPYVLRKAIGNGQYGMQESLLLGAKVIHTIVVPEPHHNSTSIYDF
jgi:hypothetical protein